MDTEDSRLYRADRHVALWLSRRADLVPDPAVFERIAHSGMGYRVALAYPDADFDTVTLISEVFLWKLALDGFSGEVAGSGDYAATARAVGEAVRALERPDSVPQDAPHYQRVAAEIAARLRQEFAASSASRVMRALRDFLWAKLWEVCVCQHGGLPGADEYLLLRQHTSSAVVAVEFVEPAGRFVLADEVRAEPAMHRLTDAVRNVMAWTNDLRTFSWELRQSTAPPTALPTLLAHRDGVSLDRALDTVSEMIAEEIRQVDQLTAELLARADDGLARYLAGLRRFTHHRDLWYEDNPRYHPREAPAIRTSGVLLGPASQDVAASA
jgi:hypothetical protein